MSDCSIGYDLKPSLEKSFSEQANVQPHPQGLLSYLDMTIGLREETSTSLSFLSIVMIEGPKIKANLSDFHGLLADTRDIDLHCGKFELSYFTLLSGKAKNIMATCEITLTTQPAHYIQNSSI